MENRIYNIDSRFRNKQIYPNSANYVYNKIENYLNANNIQEHFNEKNVIEMKITSIELPNTIYFIQSTRGNNTLLFGVNTVTVPDGSYTQGELVKYLQDNVIELPNVEFKYNSSTSKVTITNNSGNIITFPPNNIDTKYSSLGKLLGFTINTIPNDGNDYTSNIAMSEPYEPYIFLRINDYGNIFHNNKRYVAKIFTNKVSRFTDINQENILNIITNTIVFEQPININRLSISLEDMFGYPLNLNNIDWSFTIELNVITNSIIKDYEEYKFYNDKVIHRLLANKMLTYYDKQNKKLN